ncbi:MAG: hypothetical protein CTY19_05745 [Methylomonas sp.]|nr:MAG: hypothetical protein CTY19_05745 [Methylomonas sp.]
MTEQNQDTEDCIRIGLLALDHAGHQAISDLLKSPILQDISIAHWSVADTASPEHVDADNLNSFLNVHHRLDILFILADIQVAFEQERYAAILAQISSPDKLVFTIPLASNSQSGRLIYDHSLDQLTIDNHAVLIEQSTYSIGQLSFTEEQSAKNTKNRRQNLALIIYGIIGPLIHHGLIGTDLMEVQALLSQNSLIDVYLAVDNDSARAPNTARRILDYWRNTEHTVTNSSIVDVLITLIHGNDFALFELDEVAALLLPAFSEVANCKLTETPNLALDDQMAVVMFVSRPNLNPQPINDQSLGMASMLFNAKNREAV